MRSIASSITQIPALIVNGIKDLFIPDTDVIHGILEDSVNRIKTTFGIGATDLTGILGTSTQIANQDGTVSIYGLGSISGTFFDNTYLVNAVTTFRPYIRGFLVLLLIFYNLRQFFGLFRISYVDDGGNASDGGKD